MASSRLAVFFVAGAAVLCGACSNTDASNGAGPQPASGACADETRAEPYSAGMTFEGSQGVTIALVDANPAPPSLGDNTWTLEVKDSSGADIPDATFTVKQVMVDHGHGGSKTVKVTADGAGTYEAAPVNFNMSGLWETEFQVTAGTVDDKVTVNLCIP